MSVNVVRFGPGTLKLGTTPGTDFSCQVQSMGVNVNKDEGDALTVLCGDQVPGSIKYTYSLAGTLLQDIATMDGITQYSWDNAGETVAFEYVPTTAAATKIAGEVVMDPMSIGTSDGEYGDVLTSDVEWSCVGKPDVTWPLVAGTASVGGEDVRAIKSEPEPASA